MNKLRLKYNKHVIVDEGVYSVFHQYDWPGNVRELSNVLERMFVVANGYEMTAQDIPDNFLTLICGQRHEASNGAGSQEEWGSVESTGHSSHTSLRSVLEQTERAVFEQVLRESRTRTEAIRKLGISRRTFYQRLKMYGLS